MQTSDKREYPRREIKIEIDAMVSDKLIQGDTLDISGSGVFINTEWIINPDTGIQVVFLLPGQDRPFKLQGRITRIERSGIAIQFEEVNPYVQKILDEVIWKKK